MTAWNAHRQRYPSGYRKGRTMQITSLTELEERVKRGAELLDVHRPGWAMEVDTDHLESGCNVHSVTGQLFGEDVFDQLVHVGMVPDFEKPWEVQQRFADCGFAILGAEPIQVPEDIRRRITALVVELSATVGRDLSGIMSVPEVLPYPRNPDVISQEAYTMDLLWRKAVDARL